MKRLIIAAALLLAVLGATIANSRYLTGMTDGFCRQLTQSAELAAADNWPQALEKTEQTLSAWESHDFYLHTLLRHTDIDAIRLTFHEVVEYLKLEEPDQYTAANAKLITQLELLAEAERLDLKNVL
ncbi:MAG: DUF4363 family protein [Oscillospiraceae bacterium]|nr:DUF4363 family protein [Oscillospiraceae bacterium]